MPLKPRSFISLSKGNPDSEWLCERLRLPRVDVLESRGPLRLWRCHGVSAASLCLEEVIGDSELCSKGWLTAGLSPCGLSAHISRRGPGGSVHQRPSSPGGRGGSKSQKQSSSPEGQVRSWVALILLCPLLSPLQELELVEDVWRGEAQDLLSQIAQLQEENKQLMTNLNNKDVGFSEEELQKQEGEARHASSPRDHSEAAASLLLPLPPVGG